ncbi:DUF3703 domain-containing protein [Actinomadura spongiicola]|nr:DUF3703 domain-containing protein [Actinomadura spongiicola]
MTALPPRTSPGLSVRRRALLARRARWFVAATITYNLAEAVVAIGAGTPASSGMFGRTMPAQVRDAYAREMAAARTATDPAARWRHLERAHILSQPWPWPHTRNHIAMLALALAQRDRREALGQVMRIVVAAPGSALGRYPEGNTGRARVGLTRPMPVPDDLAALLARGRRGV